MGYAEKHWRCPSCLRCTNCLSSQDKTQPLLVCKKCNSPYHFNCLDPRFKATLDFDELDSDMSNFKCEFCIQCEHEDCKSRVAGPKPTDKWSSDFRLCSQCNKKKEKKMFCPVCSKFYDENSHSHEMLQCRTCDMKVHISCDRMVSGSQKNLRRLQGPNATHAYCCITCRQGLRIKYQSQLVEWFIQEDKQNIFKDRFWDTSLDLD